MRDVSLRVPAGQLLVLLGGSGSGKTTTLKMINRLIEPTAGRIEIDGRDVRTVDPTLLRRDIGYVFQGIGLFPHMTVAENVAVVPRLLGWPAGRIAARVDELLDLVHLPPGQYRSRRPGQLSGGQQQRVGFARALAAGPRVMLLDEPFGALDPVTRDELRGEFLQIRRQLGLTAVMVTHDMTEALLSADLIAVMNAGRLLRVGTPRELLTDPGDDFVAALMAGPRRQADQLEALSAEPRRGRFAMIEHLAEILSELPAYLGGHMLLSLAALAVGLATSMPLGIAAVRRPRLGEMMLSIAGVVQTVPSLAFLALMVPLLGGRIGFLPAFLALTLYSILPILSGTIVGIRGVDPAMTEAARGLGMSARQMLFRVQLPLATPVIVAGIRTSTVLVVGTATLATPVGCTTLGNYIFQGLEMNDQSVIVVGCVLAALLAVAMDQLIRLLELASRHRSRARAWFAAAGLALLTIGGMSRPIGRLVDPPHNPVVVGSGPFTEQHILSEVIKGTLPAADFTVDQRKGMGESIQFLLAPRRLDRLLRQLHRQRLVDPDEAQGRRGPRHHARRDEPVSSGSGTAWSAWVRSASRMPTPWPCAATRPRGTASARWPTSRPTRPAGRSRATSSSSAGANGRRSARNTGSSSGRPGPWTRP